MDDGGCASTDPDQLVVYIDDMESKISVLQAQVAEEVVKMERYKVSLKSSWEAVGLGLWPSCSAQGAWSRTDSICESVAVAMAAFNMQ